MQSPKEKEIKIYDRNNNGYNQNTWPHQNVAVSLHLLSVYQYYYSQDTNSAT